MHAGPGQVRHRAGCHRLGERERVLGLRQRALSHQVGPCLGAVVHER